MKAQNDIDINKCKKIASKKNIMTFLLRIALCIPFIMFIIIVNNADNIYDAVPDWFGLISLVLFPFGIYYIWKFFTEASCPQCGSHKCRFIDAEYISSEWRDKVVKRDIRDHRGNKIGDYDEGVSVRYSKYLSTYRCCLCKHEFQRMETQKD